MLVEPALRRVQLQNFFSFRDAEMHLAGLNVLVGPNGSGKSNLLRAISFMGAVARSDLLPAIDRYGGFDRILFNGERKNQTIRLRFEAVITKHASEAARDVYELSFYRQRTTSGHFLTRRNESMVFKRYAGRGRRITVNGGRFYVDELEKGKSAGPRSGSSIGSSSAGLATLRRLGGEYGAEQAEALASLFESFRVFEVDVRRAVTPTLRTYATDTLAFNAANLASYLYYLKHAREDLFESIVEDLAFVTPSVIGINVRNFGAGSDEGYLVEIVERGLSHPTPLASASFGTVRALALFAMLHDPSPPRLTCVEEIDHGLHPHALDRVVDRLRTAATRTQIIAVTHSPALVNRLDPSELIVFERDADSGETTVPKFDAEKVKEVEEEMGLGLGELWFSGVLGGIPA